MAETSPARAAAHDDQAEEPHHHQDQGQQGQPDHAWAGYGAISLEPRLGEIPETQQHQPQEDDAEEGEEDEQVLALEDLGPSLAKGVSTLIGSLSRNRRRP